MTTAQPRVPEARREDVTEVLHGHEVADPYRWLEAPVTTPEVAAFVAAQQAVTTPALAALPGRPALRDRLAALWDHPRRGAPWRRGTVWLQLRNDGLQDQDVVWVAEADPTDATTLPPAPAWRVLLDPNGWSTDGTASLSGLSVREDGVLAAFARSDAGSDWLTWRVVEVATGRVLDDEVRWARFSGAAWLPDGEAFLYGAYDAPAAGEDHTATTRGQQLRLHRIGTDGERDPVVHARPDQPEWGFHPHVSHDGRWLVLTVWRGTDPTSRVHLARLGTDEGPHGIGPVVPLLDRADASYEVLGVLDDRLLLATDHQAPNERVVAVDLTAQGGPPADGPILHELVPEHPERLQQVTLVGGAAPASSAIDAGPTAAWLVCERLHHATSRLAVHDARSGRHLHDVELAGPVTVGTVSGGRRDRAVYLTVSSFTASSSVHRHDLTTGAGELVEPAACPPDDHLVVEQVAVQHDGVGIPVFLVHRRDLRPSGQVPTVLWGYGGFDIAVTPTYQPAWRTWVDAGGLLAVACLRGGGEYGRAWYDAGRLASKPNVFRDALAVAAWLTGRRRDEVTATALTAGSDPEAVWSAPAHLGIEGRSNGGLLVGACLTSEPEAFGSAVPEVGVLDLVRFHRFTIGWAWTSDYGSPDDPDDLAVILGYSPYHRVRPGTAYPATLITTGDTDDRVVPAHSLKFAAALQAAQGGPAPVLLRVDTSAGHGAGKPVGKLIDERADVLAFHAHHLGLVVG